LLSLIIALFASTIYRLAVLSNTSILVGMAAPYIIGMHWKKANHTGALASFFSGVISWIILTFYYYPQTLEVCELEVECATWDAIYIASTPAFILSVIFFIVVSLLTQKMDPPKSLTDIFGNPVDMTNAIGFKGLSAEE
jgi:Na+/proline symporter